MAENDGTTQKFEIVEFEGKQVRKYPDGSLRNDHGAIVKISPERGRLMQQRRKITGLVEAGKAIQEATESETPEEGVRKILKKRVEVALTDNGRAGNDAAKLVLLASGHLTNERKVDVSGEVQHRAMPELDPETLEALMRIVERRRQEVIPEKPTIIEGKVTTGDYYKE